MNGDGDRNTDVFETVVNNRQRNVSYGAVENATTVLLPRDAAHKRQDYNVSVELTGGLVLTRPIHVALDTHEGTPLTAVTAQQRQNEIANMGTVPSGLNNTSLGNATVRFSQQWFENEYGLLPSPPATSINDGNRLQYGTAVAPYAAVPHNGNDADATGTPSGNNGDRRVWLAIVDDESYNENLRRESVVAFVNHEIRHLRQHIYVRDNAAAPNDVWRVLDNYFSVDIAGTPQPAAPGYAHFREPKLPPPKLNNT